MVLAYPGCPGKEAVKGCSSVVVMTELLQLQPFNGPLDFVWDYPGEPVPES